MWFIISLIGLWAIVMLVGLKIISPMDICDDPNKGGSPSSNSKASSGYSEDSLKCNYCSEDVF